MISADSSSLCSRGLMLLLPVAPLAVIYRFFFFFFFKSELFYQ